MDFENLYKKSQKKVNQKEDYLTELIAFIANISDEFKEIYLTKFLGFNGITKFEDYSFETQSRKGEETKSIADLVICKKNKVIAVCEHKIDSPINGDQLINYRNQYKDSKKFFLLKPEYNKLAVPKGWEELKWEQLFEVVKKKHFPRFWKYDTDKEYFKKEKNKIIKTTEKELIYYFLDYLVSEGLFRLDMNYYDEEYRNFSNLLKRAKDSLDRYFDYVDVLKLEKKSKQGGSKIRDLIDNWRIYIKYKKDYMGFYGYYIDENDSEFCMLEWKGKDHEPMKFEKIKKEYSEKFKKLNFESIKDFNKQFEKTVDYLQDMNSLLLEIVKFIGSKLSIKTKKFEIFSEKESGEMVYGFEYKKKYFQISFTEKSFRLYFPNTSKKPKDSKVYEIDKDWRYFEINVENMKFTEENFSILKKSFVQYMQNF